MRELIEEIFLISEQIRYVAVYYQQSLTTSSKDGIENASEAESDKYEELMVYPAVLTLTRQRGDIDCGGLNFLLIRYGNFYQYVAPITAGHLSVCIEPIPEALDIALQIQETARAYKDEG